MRSLLGRFHRPMSRGLVNNMLTMNNLGDGSTLSLDFTTGVLDPRLTFSRASTATFVNSSGYVQFANANLFRNSENTTSWSGAQSIISTANAAIAPNGTLTADQLNLGSGDYFYNVTAVTNPVGQQYVGSVWMRTVSGTASVGLRITNTVTGANSSITTCSVTETWQRFNTSTFTLTDTANRQIDVGVDQRSLVSGPAVSANIYIWGLQLQPGASVGEYLPTTTTENYNAPRFDYSPTNIGEPRGLLVEGQGINVCIYSQAIAGAGWNTTTGYTVTTNTTDLLSPAGDNTATKLVYTSGYARCIQTVNLAANTTYTMSYWIKSVMTHTFRVYDLTAGADIASSIGSIPVTSSWTRVQKTFTTGASTSSCWFYVAPDGGPTAGLTAYVWGAQVELGSGASSYIPTGASQVTRNADYLLSASSSGASRNSEFSLDDLAPGISALNEHTVLWTYGRDPNNKREYPATLYARTNANTMRVDMRDFTGTTTQTATQTRTVQTVTVGTASKVKIALAQSTSAYPSSAINGTSATLTSGVIDSALGLQWVQLGNTSAVAAAFNPIWAQQLKVYPTALTAAQLQTLTTP